MTKENKIYRNMTGIYIPIRANQVVDMSDADESTIRQFLKDKPISWKDDMIIRLSKRLDAIGEQFDIVSKPGTEKE